MAIKMNIFGRGGSKKPEKDCRASMGERREREKTLMSKMKTMLSDIEFNNNIKLPKEKIKEYNIEPRLARMYKVLDTEMVCNVDTKELDDLVIVFADSLKLALEQNLPNMAYWSSVALHKAVESLRVETPDLYASDPEMEEALYQQKLMYAKNLRMVIDLSKEQDRQEKREADQIADIDRKKSEWEVRTDLYNNMYKTPEGRELVTNMKAKHGNIAAMTEKERAVLENEKRLTTLQGLLAADYAALEVIDTDLGSIINQIETTRARLLIEPDIVDEKLAAKVKEANRVFREQLTKQLDRAYEAMQAHDEHISAMEQLMNHPAIKYKYAKVAEALEKMESEKLEQQMKKLEAQRELGRKMQNSLMLQKESMRLQNEIDQEVQKIVDDITEIETEPEIDINIDIEEDVDQEEEVEVEYDL